MRKRNRCCSWIAAWGVLLPAAGGLAQSPELDCLIEPQQAITLSFAVEGVVEEVLVDRGDLVEQGQVLARLQADAEKASVHVAQERARAKAQLQGSRARLEYAERQVTRSTALQDKEIVSEGVLDEALREKRLAEAGLLDANEARTVAGLEAERAQAVLRMRTVRSPVDGVVVERILSQGEWADPPQVLRIAQIDPLRVEVFAPLALLGRIAVGQTARVLPEQPVGGSHEAKVTVVDRVVDAASGTFGVRLELPNPDYALPAGVKCRVVFPEAPAEASRPAGPAASSLAQQPSPQEASAARARPPIPREDRAPTPEAAPSIPPEPDDSAGTAPAVEAQEPPAEGGEPPREVAATTPGRIQRAQFTTLVEHREPVDAIDTLTSDHDRVYFFTEFRGMRAQTLTHRWEHDERVVLEVPFEVRGPRWRVYSFKDLDASLLGDWTVSILDESGAPLRSEVLRYVPAPSESPPPDSEVQAEGRADPAPLPEPREAREEPVEAPAELQAEGRADPAPLPEPREAREEPVEAPAELQAEGRADPAPLPEPREAREEPVEAPAEAASEPPVEEPPEPAQTDEPPAGRRAKPREPATEEVLSDPAPTAVLVAAAPPHGEPEGPGVDQAIEEFLAQWTRSVEERDYALHRRLGFPVSESEFERSYGRREELTLSFSELDHERTEPGLVRVRVRMTFAFDDGTGLQETERELRIVLRESESGLRYAGSWD